MSREIIEAPDTTQESTVEAEITQVVPEQETAEETTTEQPAPAATQEPTVELDGEKVPLSQVKKWKEDYVNDSKWRDKNRRESEELNKKRAELAQLELLKPMVEQHPEVLQQLFAPKKSRDYERELAEHYQKRPDPTDYNAYTTWELNRDRLVAESAESRARVNAMKELQEQAAREHNLNVERSGQEGYLHSGRVSEDEFKEMTGWIVQNLNFNNGRAPQGAYDIAYTMLFKDRLQATAKTETAEQVIKQIEKATRGGADTGKNKPPVTKTAEDELDDELVDVIRRRTKNWTPLK